MTQQLNYLKESASQTAGPYVHIGLAPSAAGFDIFAQQLGADIAGPNANGERIRVTGVVLDGTGEPIKDVLLETWQANSQGHYAHPEGGGEVEPGFRGWGRVISDFTSGEWSFDTIKPGATRGRNGGQQAPHINLWLVARGINVGLHTRIYFPDEDNSQDQVLNLIEWQQRRPTLIATKLQTGLYRFNIVIQGANETIFFDI